MVYCKEVLLKCQKIHAYEVFFFFDNVFFFQLYCILFIMLIYHDNLPLAMSEADVQRCSVKKVFLEISQNSQENTCARDSFSIKL